MTDNVQVASPQSPASHNAQLARPNSPGTGQPSSTTKLLRRFAWAEVRLSRTLIFAGTLLLFYPAVASAQKSAAENCSRAAEGSIVSDPEELHSENGVLKVDLLFRDSPDPGGSMRYCYIARDGSQAPTLRVHPGDLVILTLKNELNANSSAMDMVAPMTASTDPCEMGPMTPSMTNLHFHGLSAPPVCHQDETVKTHVGPADPPFEYRFRIPSDQPPGLYWYHPHPHGFSETQVLGGASGAMIVEGIEQANPELASLPERVLIVRDGPLLHAEAQPVQSPTMPAPIVLRDAEGDILNSGTGLGKPAKDLSLNFVPVSFPNYQPAVISMRASEKQLWRVLNASADTYLDLQLLFGDAPQALGVVALDGVPITENGRPPGILWQSHILLPPAGRAEFVVKGPAQGDAASLVTRSVDTGPAGENDPTRPLARVVANANASEPPSRLAALPKPLVSAASPSVEDLKPIRERKLYFSEKPENPADPSSPIAYYLTVDGQTPARFDPSSGVPNIVVHEGDVEDWIIENRTQELHAFHIHQIHFIVKGWNGVPVDEPFLRDTINVTYWDGKSPVYPSVRLRMDFRDPNIVGDFVYHCHILEHEDGGMMGLIRVLPRGQGEATP